MTWMILKIFQIGIVEILIPPIQQPRRSQQPRKQQHLQQGQLQKREYLKDWNAEHPTGLQSSPDRMVVTELLVELRQSQIHGHGSFIFWSITAGHVVVSFWVTRNVHEFIIETIKNSWKVHEKKMWEKSCKKMILNQKDNRDGSPLLWQGSKS